MHQNNMESNSLDCTFMESHPESRKLWLVNPLIWRHLLMGLEVKFSWTSNSLTIVAQISPVFNRKTCDFSNFSWTCDKKQRKDLQHRYDSTISLSIISLDTNVSRIWACLQDRQVKTYPSWTIDSTITCSPCASLAHSLELLLGIQFSTWTHLEQSTSCL